MKDTNNNVKNCLFCSGDCPVGAGGALKLIDIEKKTIRIYDPS